MIGRMRAAADFVIAAKRRLGFASPAVEKLQDEQAKQLIAIAGAAKIEVNEAAACMSTLASAEFVKSHAKL